MIKIENLFYSPVKSISFEESESLNVLTDRGIESDRIFAFVQNLNSNSIKNLIEDPKSRKLNNFLTLKNSPELNQYNFIYTKNKLILNESIFCTKAKTRSLSIPFPSNTFKESDSVKDIDFTGE